MELFSVRIVALSADELRALAGLDLDLKYRAARELAPGRFAVDGILTDDEIRRVRDIGYAVEDVTPLAPVADARRREVSPWNRFGGAWELGEFDARTVLGYMTVDEVESALANLSAAHPALVTLLTLPELTWEGRSTHAVRVRAGARVERPGLLVTGGVHAREWGGSDVCVALAVRLVNAYVANAGLTFGGKVFTATQVRGVLENVDLFVFPDVNPDGKAHSQLNDPAAMGSQGTWWRKNRNPNGGSASKGVDVNRNFDFLWSSGIGTSSSQASFTYKGTGPFSEPESRNVRWFFDSYPAIRYYVDVHSHGGLILYSWGDDLNQQGEPTQTFTNPAFNGQRGIVSDTIYREFIPALDELTARSFAERMNAALTSVRGNPYTVQQAVGLYATSATSDDYAYSRHQAVPGTGKVIAYTIEFGNEFVPPFAEMQHIVDEVNAALVELAWAITSDLYLHDDPSDTGDTPSTGTFWDSPDIWIRNADDGGTLHQSTRRGEDNFVYVRVQNRGIAEAVNVRARVYVTSWAGTQFVHPEDWVAKNPGGGGTAGTAGTYLIGELGWPTLAAGTAAMGSVRWPAALIPPDAGWHPCLLVEVAPDDGLRPTGPHVWEGNHLGQKNITIVDARRGEMAVFRFRVGNPRIAATGALSIRPPKGGRPIAAYLDPGDHTLLPHPPGIPVTRPGLNLELLHPATVSVTLAAGPDPTPIVLRLPSRTQLAPGAPIHRDGEERGPLDIVTIGARPFLPLVSGRPSRLPLPTNAVRNMELHVRVPEDAVPGAVYRYDVAQEDAHGRTVGGIGLEVRVNG